MPIKPQWSLAHFPCASRQEFVDWNPSAPGDYAPVEVPGAVQVSSYGVSYPEILLRRNWEKVEWMEERLWVYRTEIAGCQIGQDQCRVVRFRGLDYEVRIFLNGREIAVHEGMFSPVELELDPETAARDNTIHVAFLPPKFLAVTRQTDSLNAADKAGIPHLKARYMEGWDFAPRLRCVGIWDDVEVLSASRVRITSMSVQTRLDNAARAEVAVTVHLNRPLPEGALRLELCGRRIEVPVRARDQASVVLALSNPELWFSNSHGNAALHPLAASLLDADGKSLDATVRNIGLREVRRVPAIGQRPTDTPAQFVINGQPVFLQGANIVPFSSVPGLVAEQDYLRVLQPLREAGVNFLRIWGGGLKEKDVFYRLCDEMGFLVMQEFPLACQRISREPEYLALLEKEARAIVRALAAHPCVIWWTGGNEHYHFWEVLDSGTALMNAIKEKMCKQFEIPPGDRSWRAGEDPDHPALRMLHGILQEELPSLPYNVTSGLEDQGDTHGPWNLRLEIGDHRFRDSGFFEFWRSSRSHLLSEASVAAAANAKMFARILGTSEDLSRVEIPEAREDADWVAHKAFHAAWDHHPDLWLDIPGTEEWFGPLGNLADLLFANHYLQCEATRFMIEAVRHRQGESTGIFWWGGNEPFPSLAGNALVDFFGEAKPALSILADSFAPQLLSLSYTCCVAGKLRGDVFFINSLPDSFRGAYCADVVSGISGELIDRYEGTISAGGFSVTNLCALTPLPLCPGSPVHVDVTLRSAGGKAIQQKRYRFFAEDAFPLSSLLLSRDQDPASFFRP